MKKYRKLGEEFIKEKVESRDYATVVEGYLRQFCIHLDSQEEKDIHDIRCGPSSRDCGNSRCYYHGENQDPKPEEKCKHKKCGNCKNETCCNCKYHYSVSKTPKPELPEDECTSGMCPYAEDINTGWSGSPEFFSRAWERHKKHKAKDKNS